MYKFVLASQSPRRRELLEGLNIDFRVIADNSPETADLTKPPQEVVQTLARQKAKNIMSHCTSGDVIIAADTVVVLDNKILGKPSDKTEANAMLRFLGGKTHTVYTGLCVADVEKNKVYTDFESTDVTFKVLTDSEILAYISSGEPMDKAGAYGIQALGALFIEKINGDYFNVVGLPLCKLGKILKDEFDISLL